MSIKAGDLVMVVKPTKCCGNVNILGRVSTAKEIYISNLTCRHCSYVERRSAVIMSDGMGADMARLKKIEPSADGDSLPTRRELEVPA